MSCPTLDVLEAHARDELDSRWGRERPHTPGQQSRPDSSEKSSLRAHLAACAACAREAEALAAEQRLFAGRAAHMATELAGALPAFDGVLARARAERVPEIRLRRVAWASFGLAAAAAILGLFYTLRAPAPAPAASAAEDIGPDLVCFDGAPAPALEPEAHPLEEAIAGVENEYAACLIATPISNDGREFATTPCSVDATP